MSPFERGVRIGFMLACGRTLTTKDLRHEFNVSPAQAKRDLLVIEVALAADVVVGKNNQTTITRSTR